MSRYNIILIGIIAILNFLPLKIAAQLNENTNKQPLSINEQSAVILIYHHVDETTPKSTSVTPLQFSQHIEYLRERYAIRPLSEIVDSLKNGKALENRTVAITFDDGYANIYQNAHPLMKQYDIPYTVFINPDTVGKQKNQLSWAQINKMQQEGAEFANHTLDHLHMLNRYPSESSENWLTRVWQNVEDAEKIIAEKTGKSLKFLAYPFGEYNSILASKLLEEGYIGFGQQSGGAGAMSNFAALPRFPAAGPYANLKTLKTKLESLAMPVKNVTPEDPERTSRFIEQPISFEITSDDVGLHAFNCFFQGSAVTTQQTKKLINLQFDKRLPIGRSRINCTAPSKSMKGRYYWYSMPFFVANNNGKYPD